MEKLKIAYARTQFWFDLKSGGSVGHTLGVLNGLKNNGIQVKIFSNEKFTGIDNFNFKIKNPVIKTPLWLGEILYNFYARKKFIKFLNDFKPDTIYHRYSGYSFFVTKAAKVKKIPLILEFNSFDTWKLKNWERSRSRLKRIFQTFLLYPIVKKIEHYNLSGASLITVVSEPLKKDLIKMGFLQEKILVNPNGFDASKFNPELSDKESGEKLRGKLNIDKGKLIVGFCGTFGHWHGIPQLTDAIEMILKNEIPSDDINFHFLIIGDGGELKQMMLSRLSDYSEVTFTGMVQYSFIQDYLSICDILVSPHNAPMDNKEFFGSPTKLFEYMAAGKGIVASRLGQIGKILENEKTAILVEPGNTKELAEGILKLARDKELRDKIGKEASRVAFGNYTWDKNVMRLIKKLEEVNIIKR